jgi:hypothetical protein
MRYRQKLRANRSTTDILALRNYGRPAGQYLKRKLAERVGDRQELLIPTGESPFEKASLNHS